MYALLKDSEYVELGKPITARIDNEYAFTKILTAVDEFGSIQSAVFVGFPYEKKTPSMVMNTHLLHTYGDILNSLEEFIMEPNDKANVESTDDTWVKESLELFPGIRDLTKEEADLYREALTKLFEPTGRNLFDL